MALLRLPARCSWAGWAACFSDAAEAAAVPPAQISCLPKSASHAASLSGWKTSDRMTDMAFNNFPKEEAGEEAAAPVRREASLTPHHGPIGKVVEISGGGAK